MLGGVPTGKVRYDNLKAAVARVLGFSRARVETERWTAFRSHWGIESFYCRPGLVGAHEKGGVEGDIGFFRRNHLVPVPDVASLEELNAMIEGWDSEDDARRIRGRVRTVGEYFEVECPLLEPLPTELFETSRLFTVRVNRYSQITVRTNRYSVPVRYIGRRVRVLLHASHLVVYDGAREVCQHERLIAKAGSRLELDHYLETLVYKPGALPGATTLEQARASGSFTPVHDAWWAAARKTHGDRDGTRALIEVLLLGRHMRREHIVAGLAAALRAGGADLGCGRAGGAQGGRVGPGAGRDRTGLPVTGAADERGLPRRPPARRHPAAALGGRLRPAAAPKRPSAPIEPARMTMATTTPPRRRGLTEQAADTAVDQACRMLRLPTIRAKFPELAESAAREQMSYLGFLAELLMAECDDRAWRRSERRIKAAAFPRDKALREFDFEANPNVDPAVIHTLAKCEWVRNGKPLCLIGDSGLG